MIAATKNLQARFEQLFDPLPYAEPTPPSKVQAGVYLAVAIAFLVEVVFTRSSFVGDSYFYIDDILGYLRGDPAATARMADSGHLLLRPLGAILSPLASHLVSRNAADVRLWSVTAALVALNWIGTLVCAICIAAWGLRITRSPVFSALAAIGFLYTNTILSYSRSGTSYIPGVACLILAAYVASGQRSRGWAPGFLAGIAVLFWLPYAFTVPAVLFSRNLSPASWQPPVSRRFVNFAVRFCIVTGLVVAVGYSVAIHLRGISNWADLMHWVREAAHGVSRQGRLVRSFFGMPRSLIAMSNEGIIFKRFLFHDPYAKVTWLDILRVSLAKAAIFYLGVAFLMWRLLVSVIGRRVFYVFVLALIPNLMVALAYESGSIERYLAIFPFLFLGAAVVMSEWRFSRSSAWAIALLIGALSIGNAISLSANRVKSALQQEDNRVAVLSQCSVSDKVFLLTGQDGLFAVRYRLFDTRAKSLPYLVPVEPVTGDVAAWRSMFAAITLETWRKGGSVWVTRRVLANTPEPEWNWVEGDDSRISWKAVHAFFDQLDPDETLGGADGIFKIAPSERNQQILSGLVPHAH